MRPFLRPNRIKTAEESSSERSRVILFEGPREIVDENYLAIFFTDLSTFDTDEVAVIYEDQTIRQIRYGFASYRGQAQNAWKWCRAAQSGRVILGRPRLSDEEVRCWRQVWLSWGADPCA
ncbi:Uu.00g080000.m01.CDS01 [Anthostomella pinea]|uniref:Uu.00g080000.m01.CDS01 n=1 Tax=Anthostomella pinea TaxID=933095 RepID=A0AAI8VKX9_9PEZI|nr:Uu.00g080000.m01.CDS01 [Anthostomella pinea]